MTPEVISCATARRNLGQVMRDCVKGSAPVIITGRSGRVVMIPYDDWASEQETQYLLSDAENRRHLLESVEQIRRGEVVEYKGMGWDEDRTEHKS